MPAMTRYLDHWATAALHSGPSRIAMVIVSRFYGKILEVEMGGVGTYPPFGEFRRANSYRHLYDRKVDVRVYTKSENDLSGEIVRILRITLDIRRDLDLPFVLKRTQFPLKRHLLVRHGIELGLEDRSGQLIPCCFNLCLTSSTELAGDG
ncbi:hypothetical protein TNCV_499391 [Trichonephila clavipes]|nr:hypothetical protein TNCV_499391 [Trichonephila clavipes]